MRRGRAKKLKKTFFCIDAFFYMAIIAFFIANLFFLTPIWYKFGWISTSRMRQEIASLQQEIANLQQVLFSTSDKLRNQLSNLYREELQNVDHSLKALTVLVNEQSNDTKKVGDLAKSMERSLISQLGKLVSIKKEIPKLNNSKELNLLRDQIKKIGISKEFDEKFKAMMNKLLSIENNVHDVHLQNDVQIMKIVNMVHQIQLSIQSINSRSEYLDENLNIVKGKVKNLSKDINKKLVKVAHHMEVKKKKTNFKI